MDDITSRTFIIAVNIFVTLTIVSLIIIMFFQMRSIYGYVATTDISIYNKFDNISSKYNGKETTGIGLLNALKTYEDDEKVTITYVNSEQIRKEIADSNNEKEDKDKSREVDYLKKIMKANDTYKGTKYMFEDRYIVSVTKEKDESVVIDFVRKNK